jgi:transposase
MRDSVTTEERDRIKTLERENRELCQANEILRKTSAYFTPTELEHPLKR